MTLNLPYAIIYSVKGVGFLAGTVFGTVIKAIYKLLKLAVRFIAAVIFYFGLYIPLIYLVYGGILQLITGFVPFGLSTDSLLYILGFGLCLGCALIISVRNIIVKPFNKRFGKQSIIEYKDAKKLSKNAPEAPTIYKSKVNKGVTVYEYSNRYDLYEEDDYGLRLVETEFKSKKPQRRQ